MQELRLSGLFVAPLAGCVSYWLDVGKLDDDDLDRALTCNARAIVDASSEPVDWIPLDDVESLVAVVAEQLGDSAGLVEWVENIVGRWSEDIRIAEILHEAASLVDATGYAVTQASECLIHRPDWRYDGGRERFSVRLLGLESASPALRTLLGAFLSRLAERVEGGFEDLRFDGVDGGEFCIFAEAQPPVAGDVSAESRLHRATLIG